MSVADERGRVSARIKADGDTWRAELAADGDDWIVVFFCTTTDQRPYRVVQVADDRYPDDTFESVSDEDLQSLFEASRSMGAPKDYPTYGA